MLGIHSPFPLEKQTNKTKHPTRVRQTKQQQTNKQQAARIHIVTREYHF